MQKPSLRDADTTFEELLQELPPGLEKLARENNALRDHAKSRMQRIRTVRVVFALLWIDKSLREDSGSIPLLSDGDNG